MLRVWQLFMLRVWQHIAIPFTVKCTFFLVYISFWVIDQPFTMEYTALSDVNAKDCYYRQNSRHIKYF